MVPQEPGSRLLDGSGMKTCMVLLAARIWAAVERPAPQLPD